MPRASEFRDINPASSLTAASQNIASLTSTSSQIVAANTARRGLFISNISAGSVYIRLDGATATIQNGILLAANGGSVLFDNWVPSGAITGISAPGPGNVIVAEG